MTTAIDPFSPDMLVGFSGPAGSGKDTCAQILADYGFRQLAFADALRQELVEAFKVDLQLFTDRRTKEEPTAALAVERCSAPTFMVAMARLDFDLGAPRSPRWLMQHWGTDYRRQQDSNYWLHILGNQVLRLRSQCGIRRFCVTDVRFANELALVESLIGRCVYVYRANRAGTLATDTAAHPSEPEALARLLPVVHNDGDFEHLRNELVRVLGAGSRVTA